ncbi:MAG: hypothetical protein P4L85_29020 [Paludisphaera borealis]|uniref:hypothetical protein n=1 Tax=Paludisphaera borealis TaxID=1387353 RepID=UPI00283E74A5|nr:hypothetical protein [Paludisphaera borealis]MDR3623410.1 hypothetical protein [Paludisphaera borealis]
MNDTPAHFIAVCPSCLIGLKVNYEYSGRMVRCRHCDEAFRPFSPDFGTVSGSAEYAVGPVAPADDESELIVSCPSCATTLSVRARYEGRHVRCGACRHKFRVVADSSAPATPTTPPIADSDPVDHDGPTPDPDVTRSELAHLNQEVATLREWNDLLLGRHDELKREVESLRAQVQRVEADREAAESQIAELTDRVDRNARRLGPVGLAPLEDHDGRRATVPFVQERSAASGR